MSLKLGCDILLNILLKDVIFYFIFYESKDGEYGIPGTLKQPGTARMTKFL